MPKCQEPRVVTLGFSSSEDGERQLKSASSNGLCFGLDQVYTAVTAARTCSWAATPTPTELQVLQLDSYGTQIKPKLTRSRFRRQFQCNSAPHLNWILFSR